MAETTPQPITTIRNRKGEGMILFDQTIAEGIPMGTREDSDDPMVYLRYFFQHVYFVYYVLSARVAVDDILFEVLAFSDECPDGEFSYASLNEMANVVDPRINVGFERDLHFEPTRLSEIRKSVLASKPKKVHIFVC